MAKKAHESSLKSTTVVVSAQRILKKHQPELNCQVLEGCLHVNHHHDSQVKQPTCVIQSGCKRCILRPWFGVQTETKRFGEQKRFTKLRVKAKQPNETIWPHFFPFPPFGSGQGTSGILRLIALVYRDEFSTGRKVSTGQEGCALIAPLLSYFGFVCK